MYRGLTAFAADMHRTQLYLTKDQTAALDRLARQRGVRRSALVRRAVDRLLAEEDSKDDWKKVWTQAWGMWKDRPHLVERMLRIRRELNKRIRAR